MLAVRFRLDLVLLASLVSAALAPSATAAGDPFEFTFMELAPGIWAGQRPDSVRLPVMGNTLFVVTDEGVIIFDGGGIALMAERLLEKIAAVTDQPVTHVGISHWHGDHSIGIWPILAKFPDAEVLAHSFTRAAMLGSPVAYIDKYPFFLENYGEEIQLGVEQGVDSDGNEISAGTRQRYAEFVPHFDLVDAEFKRARSATRARSALRNTGSPTTRRAWRC
jgi:hypothetical protein